MGSSAAASLCSHQKPLGGPFRHPAGGGIPHRWSSSSSPRSPWRGGSSSPLGLRVCTSSYVFDLSLSCSLSCSLYGTILMYPELCYCSWILWCFSPSTLVMNWVSPLKLSYRIDSLMNTWCMSCRDYLWWQWDIMCLLMYVLVTNLRFCPWTYA